MISLMQPSLKRNVNSAEMIGWYAGHVEHGHELRWLQHLSVVTRELQYGLV